MKRQKDKLTPKPMSAENAKFKADRAGEKMANAARAMGKKVESLGGAGKKPAAVSAGSRSATPIRYLDFSCSSLYLPLYCKLPVACVPNSYLSHQFGWKG